MKYKSGDRVINNSLNICGTITGTVYGNMYYVTYDEEPPITYNLGNRETIVFDMMISKLEEQL